MVVLYVVVSNYHGGATLHGPLTLAAHRYRASDPTWNEWAQHVLHRDFPDEMNLHQANDLPYNEFVLQYTNFRRTHATYWNDATQTGLWV